MFVNSLFKLIWYANKDIFFKSPFRKASVSYIPVKPFDTSLVLYLSRFSLAFHLIVNTHFHSAFFFSLDKSTTFQVSVILRAFIYFITANF